MLPLIPRGAFLLIAIIFIYYSRAELATFTSLPNVLTTGDTIQLVVGYNNKIPSRVQFVGFRGCVSDSSCNQVVDLSQWTSAGSSSYWRSAINYTLFDYDGYCGGSIRAWYNDSSEPVTEPLVQGNRTFNVLLQRGIPKVAQPSLTSLSIDVASGFVRTQFEFPAIALSIKNVSAELRCGDTSATQSIGFVSESSSFTTVWTATLPPAPQNTLCLLTTVEVIDSLDRPVQFARLNRPYWSGSFPLTQLSFSDETSAAVPFPIVYRVTATLSADSTVGAQWSDVGVRISDCIRQSQDWYFGGVSGELLLTGKTLTDLRGTHCAVTLLFKTDAQVEAVSPQYILSSLPSSFEVNILSRAPTLVSLRVSPRVVNSPSETFTIDATLSGRGESAYNVYAVLSPADLLLPGNPDATSITLTPVAEDLDNTTTTSSGEWERRWRASNVSFANVKGTRGGRVSQVCVPYPFGSCLAVVDTVASYITLQQGAAYSAPTIAKFNYTRCAGSGTLFVLELEDLDTTAVTSCAAAPLASIRTERIFQCDEQIEVPLRCTNVHLEGEVAASAPSFVRVTYTSQRILHSTETVQLRVKLSAALQGPSLVRNYTVPLVQDPRCSYVAPGTGGDTMRRRPLGAVLGFTVSLLVLAIILTIGIWQRRRIRSFIGSLRSPSGLQPSASISSVDSADDRKDLMERDDDMTL